MMRTTPTIPAGSPLEARIAGSLGHRYTQELFRNSGQFPIANLLLELLLEGPQIFLAPDIYVLVVAALLQAWVIARWEHIGTPHPFIGNLAGPAAYTAVESLFEGSAFFDAPNHIAYWIFALAIGLLQWSRSRTRQGVGAGALVATESVVRA